MLLLLELLRPGLFVSVRGGHCATGFLDMLSLRGD